MKPGDLCDDTCTVDCGHCKGAGKVTAPLDLDAIRERVECARMNAGPWHPVAQQVFSLLAALRARRKFLGGLTLEESICNKFPATHLCEDSSGRRLATYSWRRTSRRLSFGSWRISLEIERCSVCTKRGKISIELRLHGY